MKLTFIVAAIGKKKGEKYIGTWKMEPLTIAVLKSLTPAEIETEFYDDRIEEIHYGVNTDAVMISIETYTARRSYQIADKFRQRGIKVLMGGYHPTLLPDETADYCDAVITGNAEPIWLQILKDLQQNNLKKRYNGEFQFSEIVPDRSIFKNKKYLPLTLVETGRGCNFSCNFCAIEGYYHSAYLHKPINLVVEEIKNARHKVIFFVDDNIVANSKHAIELFKAITPLNITWSGQATLNISKNPELLYWMKKSGCELILIGFESLDEENLNQMNKSWRMKIGEQNQLIKNIHKAGISIYATFVFGFDNDTSNTVLQAKRFADKHKFYVAAFNHLLAFPGTTLYDELKQNKRFITEKWWLDPDYHYGEICFNPKSVSAKELSISCVNARNNFFSVFSIIKRGMALFFRRPKLKILLAYWMINLSLKKEVNQKFGLPMGDGLDEKNR
jgi:radical SAM superfamily enzyme YgiQ (UPF0313 family)